MELRELLATARAEADEERRWALVCEAPRTGGSAAVLAEVLRLLGSADPEDQRLGGDLAGQMAPAIDDAASRAWVLEKGWPPLPEPTPFAPADRDAAAQALQATLRASRNPDVIDAAIVAVGKLDLPQLVPDVIAHAGCDDEDVRASIGYALHGMELADPEPAHAVLVALAHDPSEHVRAWVLMALRSAGPDGWPLATPEAVAAYRANAEDPEDEVRLEAVISLALLGDAPSLAVALERWPERMPPEEVEEARRRIASHAPPPA